MKKKQVEIQFPETPKKGNNIINFKSKNGLTEPLGPRLGDEYMDRQSSLFDAVLTNEKDPQTKQQKMKTEKKKSYSTGRYFKGDLQPETRKVS